MNKNKRSMKEVVENFQNSDSLPATAAKIILMSLAVGPLIVAAAAFPNILSAMNPAPKYRRNYSKKQLSKSFQNLKYRKLVEITKEKRGRYKVKLTNKGQKRARAFCLETLKIAKPKKWDGKWRILIFDIPIKPKTYHQAREALRRKIKELGFFQLQKSVWAYPFECEDEILFIAELFKVQNRIEMITAEKILHEDKLKMNFKLS